MLYLGQTLRRSGGLLSCVVRRLKLLPQGQVLRYLRFQRGPVGGGFRLRGDGAFALYKSGGGKSNAAQGENNKV